MYKVDIYSDKPLYQQLIDETKSMLILGILKDGDKLLSIRELSTMLGVNPTTVSKAYYELEREGFVVTSRGRGSFITTQNIDEEKLVIELKSELKAVVKKSIFIKADIEELKLLLESAYEEVYNEIERQ